MNKVKTFPIVLILLLLLATGCGNLPQEATVPVLSGEGETTSNVETGIVPAVDISVPVAQSVPDTAVSGDIVTEQTYVNIYKQANPGVVNIQVVGNATSSMFQLPEGQIPDIPEHEEIPEGFEDFFENLPEDFDPEDIPQFPSTGQGSGFVYDKEGHIITNNHVIEGATDITVIFADGTEAEATIVGADPGSDLAVIKVDVPADQLVPLVIGDSDMLEVGQLVATIGNPFGLDGSMSTGIVSGLGRTLPGAVAPGGAQFNIPNIIQTDAVINPGNSGGPLLNLDGQVIGVNTAIQTDPSSFALTPSFGGVGYAVPVNILKRVVPQLIENGSVETAWMGISGSQMTRDVAEAMGLEVSQRGVLVQEVLQDGPAAKAGLRGSSGTTQIDGFDVFIGGDVIVKIDDQPVNQFDDLLGYIVTQASVGQTVTIQVIRDGELMDISLTLEARPSVNP
ncbi:MAG: trypsin-like peptidase domain-containing protein [Anaerolineae bacterium]|nr:trypsin-like peptidase domain-containing protein [Anaerolineae bacterium]